MTEPIVSVEHFWKLDANGDGRISGKESKEAVKTYDTDDPAKTVELWEYMQKTNEQRKAEIFGTEKIKAWQIAYQHHGSIKINLPPFLLLDLLATITENISEDPQAEPQRYKEIFNLLPNAFGGLLSAGLNPSQAVDYLKYVSQKHGSDGYISGGIVTTHASIAYSQIPKIIISLRRAGFNANQALNFLYFITETAAGRLHNVPKIYEASAKAVKILQRYGLNPDQIITVVKYITVDLYPDELYKDLAQIIPALRAAGLSPSQVVEFIINDATNSPVLHYSLPQLAKSAGYLKSEGFSPEQIIEISRSVTIEAKTYMFSSQFNTRVATLFTREFESLPSAVAALISAGLNQDQILKVIESLKRNTGGDETPIYHLPRAVDALRNAGFSVRQISEVLLFVDPGAYESLSQIISSLASAGFSPNQIIDFLKEVNGAVGPEIININAACEAVPALIQAGFTKAEVFALFDEIPKLKGEDRGGGVVLGNFEDVAFQALPALVQAGFTVEQITDFIETVISPSPVPWRRIPGRETALTSAIEILKQEGFSNEEILDFLKRVAVIAGESDIIVVYDEILPALFQAGFSRGEALEFLKIDTNYAYLPKAVFLLKQLGFTSQQILVMARLVATTKGPTGVVNYLPDDIYETAFVLKAIGLNTNEVFDLLKVCIPHDADHWKFRSEFLSADAYFEVCNKARELQKRGKPLDEIYHILEEECNKIHVRE